MENICEKCNKSESSAVIYLYDIETCVGAKRVCESCFDEVDIEE